MTKQSEDQSCNQNKPKRKHSAVKTPQQPKLVRKDFSTVSLIGLPEEQHKYFILGGILIDFDQLQRIWAGQQQFYTLKEFNHIRSVSYIPSSGFFDVSIETAVHQIADFSFIIKMLDSLGDEQAHGTANALRKYLSSLKALERKEYFEPSIKMLQDTCQNSTAHNLEVEIPNSDTTMQPINSESSTRLGDLNHEDYQQSLVPVKSTGEWNFQDSLSKVSQILADENIRKAAQFYFVVRANQNCFQVSNYGVCESAMRRVLGQIDQSELTKLLLDNGVLFINPIINQIIEMKSQELDMYLSNPTAADPEYMRFVKRMKHITLNNFVTDLEFTLERYRLSNYPNCRNDYLVIAKLDDIQLQMLMNQLFMQKLNSFMEPGKKILQDIRYQAQSEYFTEKYYSSKPSQIPTTDSAFTDNTNRFINA